MASYFNWWGPTFFYKLINLDGMGAGETLSDLSAGQD